MLSALGSFLCALTKRLFNVADIMKFDSLQLFTKLVIEHFIESKSLNLFLKGLSIVKNLVRVDAREASKIIFVYEECCANSFVDG